MARMLVTAGPTREPIDAVRYVGNRSSGRMGVAIAQAAMDRGHTVTLLLGPGVTPPEGCAVHQFQSTADLEQLLAAHWPEHDVLIMAAAVADYRPEQVVDGKLPRDSDGSLTLKLVPTPDLTLTVSRDRRPDQRIVSFALEEPDKLLTRAPEKMRRKGSDAIVANPLATMDSDTIAAHWFTASGEHEEFSDMPKQEFADWLVQRVEQL